MPPQFGPAKSVLVVAIGFTLAFSSGCRRDDTSVVGPAGSALEPVKSAPSSSSPSAAVAPAPVPVPMTPFDSKEPTAFRSPVESAGCALDQVTGGVAAETMEVARAGEIRLVGWAADTGNKTVPPVVVVQLAGPKTKYYAPAVRSTLRQDVAEAFSAPALVSSGWDLLTTFSNVAPGTYDVHILAVGAGGDTTTCDSKKKLVVK